MKRPMFRSWLAMLIASTLALPAISLAQVNLLTNPGFENGGGSYTGWTKFGNGIQLSLPAGDDIIRTGGAAAKAFGEFSGCPTPNFDVGGFFQAVTPTVGKRYELSGYAFVSSGDPMLGTDTCANNRMVAKIAFFSLPVGGSELAVNEVVIGSGNVLRDQWNFFSLSAIAPAGARRVEALFLFLQPGCDTGAVFVDDTAFYELDPPTPKSNLLANPSFDSALSDWLVFENVLADNRSFALRTPPGSVKLYGPFTTAGASSGLYQVFPAEPGSVWRLDAWSMHTCQGNPAERTAGDNFGVARIVFRNIFDEEIDNSSDEVVLIDKDSPLATWTEHGVIAKAPDGTFSVAAYILYVQPNPLEGGSMLVDDVSFRQLQPTDVAVPPASPRFELRQNEPNPFNPSTRIDFALPEKGVVGLRVYDVAGRWITTLVEGSLDAGPHHVTWDGRAANGVPVAAGTYRYVLRTSTGKASRSMVLLK